MDISPTYIRIPYYISPHACICVADLSQQALEGVLSMPSRWPLPFSCRMRLTMHVTKCLKPKAATHRHFLSTLTGASILHTTLYCPRC